MYGISADLYRQAAMRLQEAIDGENYYSGAFTFRFGALECRMVISVIVYRRRVEAPDFAGEPISDLVPVWWEFHTFSDEDELLNDFDFNELKNYI